MYICQISKEPIVENDNLIGLLLKKPKHGLSIKKDILHSSNYLILPNPIKVVFEKDTFKLVDYNKFLGDRLLKEYDIQDFETLFEQANEQNLNNPLSILYIKESVYNKLLTSYDSNVYWYLDEFIGGYDNYQEIKRNNQLDQKMFFQLAYEHLISEIKQYPTILEKNVTEFISEIDPKMSEDLLTRMIYPYVLEDEKLKGLSSLAYYVGIMLKGNDRYGSSKEKILANYLKDGDISLLIDNLPQLIDNSFMCTKLDNCYVDNFPYYMTQSQDVNSQAVKLFNELQEKSYLHQLLDIDYSEDRLIYTLRSFLITKTSVEETLEDDVYVFVDTERYKDNPKELPLRFIKDIDYFENPHSVKELVNQFEIAMKFRTFDDLHDALSDY